MSLKNVGERRCGAVVQIDVGGIIVFTKAPDPTRVRMPGERSENILWIPPHITLMRLRARDTKFIPSRTGKRI